MFPMGNPFVSVSLLLPLLISNYFVSSLDSDDFLVSGLDEIEPVFGTFHGTMHAGVIPITPDINDETNGLMFWLFQRTGENVANNIDDDSLVIWFNGGPGCSSFDAGLLLETGPVTAPSQPAGSYGKQGSNDHLAFNPFAWTNATSMMYVEQPVGVGFSYGMDPPTKEAGVASDFDQFLQHFYTIFPEYAQKRLFLFAESYAGMYVPSMAIHIYHKNKHAASSTKSRRHIVNLKGIALGNGWADPMTQGGTVIDYAWWHGMIDSVTRDALHLEWEHCKQRSDWEPHPFHPFTTPDDCGTIEAVLKAAGADVLDSSRLNPNMYDVTTFDTYKVLTTPGNTFETFLNNPLVQEKLNVPADRIGTIWQGCLPGAGRRRRLTSQPELLPGQLLLKDDAPLTMGPYLSELLDQANIRILIYNGDRDVSTCAQGSEMMLNKMKWSGSEDWHNVQSYDRSLWMVDDYPAGWVKTVKNLDFLVVYNSGHLVPYNVPAQSLDLVTRFLSDQSFGDIKIPVVFDPASTEKVASYTVKESVGRDESRARGVLYASFWFSLGIAFAVASQRYACRSISKYEPVRDVTGGELAKLQS